MLSPDHSPLAQFLAHSRRLAPATALFRRGREHTLSHLAPCSAMRQAGPGVHLSHPTRLLPILSTRPCLPSIPLQPLGVTPVRPAVYPSLPTLLLLPPPLPISFPLPPPHRPLSSTPLAVLRRRVGVAARPCAASLATSTAGWGSRVAPSWTSFSMVGAGESRRAVFALGGGREGEGAEVRRSKRAVLRAVPQGRGKMVGGGGGWRAPPPLCGVWNVCCSARATRTSCGGGGCLPFLRAQRSNWDVFSRRLGLWVCTWSCAFLFLHFFPSRLALCV